MMNESTNEMIYEMNHNFIEVQNDIKSSKVMCSLKLSSFNMPLSTLPNLNIVTK